MPKKSPIATETQKARTTDDGATTGVGKPDLAMAGIPVSACVTVEADDAEATIWLMVLPRAPVRYAHTVVIGATTTLSCEPRPVPPLAAKTPMTRKLWRLILIV